jgi:hypothetical protein
VYLRGFGVCQKPTAMRRQSAALYSRDGALFIGGVAQLNENSVFVSGRPAV